MDAETVTLAHTEWTLAQLAGEPVEIGVDEIAPSLDLEEASPARAG